MDVGRTFEKGALGGRSFFQRTIDRLSRTSAFLAVLLRFIARHSERMATRLEGSSRWLHAKAVGVPLGVDVAGEDWEEPAFLPEAPEPPPIPPAAFFRPTPPAQDAEWSAALAAAKQEAADPEPTEAEWEAALLAAKKAEAQAELDSVGAPKADVVRKTVEIPPLTERTSAKPAEAPRALTPAPSLTPKPAPAPKIAELRVGPKSAGPRAVEPHVALRPGAASRDTTPKPVVPPPDSHAAATRKAISAALRG